MSKLHEKIAVDSDMKGQAKRMRDDLAVLFEKKKERFSGVQSIFVALEEGVEDVLESELPLQTTVRKELSWYGNHLEKVINIGANIAEGNTTAKANVTIDGQDILSNIPATELMELEKRIKEFQDLINKAPTLDPSKGFDEDHDHRLAHVYQAAVTTKKRGKKVPKSFTTAKATKEHPEQVHVYNEDVPTGDLRTFEWSGRITPNEKFELLHRCEELRRAIKQALSRANNELIMHEEIDHGQAVVSFILGD